MAIDLRLRYDRATKERAAAMFAEGLRPAAVAAATGAPADTVREWELAYRACGRDVLCWCAIRNSPSVHRDPSTACI